jgi:hypothetical protein
MHAPAIQIFEALFGYDMKHERYDGHKLTLSLDLPVRPALLFFVLACFTMVFWSNLGIGLEVNEISVGAAMRGEVLGFGLLDFTKLE